MSNYVGDILVGATVRGTFNTRDTAGAPITLASGTIRVYKDDGTTEDDSGITLNTDFDGRTGLHLWEIDTSADGTFYSAGSDFFVVLTVGTVNTISVVGVQVGHFSIENRNIKANVIQWLGTAAATPTVAGVPEVDLTHVAGSTTNVAALATNVDAILTDTGTTLQGELDGIQADTEDIQARLPAALTGDGNIKADMLAISGDTVAADNFESYTDGSEYMPVDSHAQEFSVSGGQLTTKKPDGVTNTPYSPKTVTSNPAAEPITGVS